MRLTLCTRLARLACGAAALLALAAPAGRAFGQDEKLENVTVKFRRAPQGPAADVRNGIVLRTNPGFLQPVHLVLHNAGPLRENVKVTLHSVSGKVVGPALLEGVVAKLAPQADTPVAFKPAELPKDAKEPKDVKEDMALRDIGPPPHELQLRSGEQVLATFRVLLQHPAGLVAVTGAPSYDEAKKRLVVTVGLDQNARNTAPPVPVELVLDPAVIPGLAGVGTRVTKTTIGKDDPGGELSASNVTFTGPRPRNGRIYLRADDYDRAFMYTGNFVQGTSELLNVSLPRARVVAPRYQRSGPTLEIPLETDGPINQGHQVEVAVDTTGRDEFRAPKVERGLRDEKIRVKVDPAGHLLFKAQVSDWRFRVPADGVTGVVRVRVRILDVNGNPVDLQNEQDEAGESLSLFSTGPENLSAPLQYLAPQKAVIATIVIDDTRPLIEFVDVPKALALRASFRPAARVLRTAEQAPVEKLFFFLGAPPKEGPPKDAVPAAFDVKRQAWVAAGDLRVPDDQKGDVLVSAWARTYAGLTDERTVKVPLDVTAPVVNGKVVAKGKLGVILGEVTRGGRPQPNVLVNLTDPKGNVKMSGKTDAGGRYQFLDVLPGEYRVVASQPAQKLLAVAAVELPESPTVITRKADLVLLTQPK